MPNVEPEQCGYCYRVPVATIYLRRTPLDVLLGRANRKRRVCLNHIHREDRPGGRYA